jgi:hypothetical protein
VVEQGHAATDAARSRAKAEGAGHGACAFSVADADTVTAAAAPVPGVGGGLSLALTGSAAGGGSVAGPPAAGPEYCAIQARALLRAKFNQMGGKFNPGCGNQKKLIRDLFVGAGRNAVTAALFRLQCKRKFALAFSAALVAALFVEIRAAGAVTAGAATAGAATAGVTVEDLANWLSPAEEQVGAWQRSLFAADERRAALRKSRHR